MPKKVFSVFDGGLTEKERNANDNQFYVGINVDIHSLPGYARPGLALSNISVTGLTGLIGEMVRNNARHLYLFSDNKRLFHINNFDSDTVNTDVDGLGNTFRTVSDMGTNFKGIVYFAKSTVSGVNASREFVFLPYTYSTTDLGEVMRIRTNVASPFIRNSNSVFAPTFLASKLGGSDLNIGGRDVELFEGYLWFTNGRYVGRYDGQGSGANGNWTADYFDLGADWITRLVFVSPSGFLGIIATQNGTSSLSADEFSIPRRCKIVYIDGSSSTISVKEVILEGVYAVLGVKVLNGIVYACVETIKREKSFGVITNNGFDELYPLKQEVSGTLYYLAGGNKNTIEVVGNKLYFGTTSDTDESTTFDYIFSYGRDSLGQNRLSMPIIGGGTNTTKSIGCIKPLDRKLYISRRDGSSYYLNKVDLTSTTYGTATLKWSYADFGQKVRINYVKSYSRPLVSGDELTVGIDTDYGTSNTLGIGTGNVKYGNDGAITSKRFGKPIICHAFRPTINWVSGGTPISKVVVDYDFVDDL